MTLRERWRLLRRGRPGRRFEERYERTPNGAPLKKCGQVGLGILLALVGLVLLFFPGPGILLLLVGAALAAEESRTVARWLDRAEVGVRRAISSARRRFRRSARPAQAAPSRARSASSRGGKA